MSSADRKKNGGNYEKFSLEYKPPPNYQSVLRLRNREQYEKDKKLPKEKIPPHMAVCGMNCTECEYFAGELGNGEKQGCPGCNVGGNDCDIRICCLVKSCKSCYECGDFPCDKLKASDAESDDSDLVKFRSERDTEKDRLERKRSRIICGGLTGFLVGLLMDMVLNNNIVWLLAGIIIGIAIPAMVYADR